MVYAKHITLTSLVYTMIIAVLLFSHNRMKKDINFSLYKNISLSTRKGMKLIVSEREGHTHGGLRELEFSCIDPLLFSHVLGQCKGLYLALLLFLYRCGTAFLSPRHLLVLSGPLDYQTVHLKLTDCKSDPRLTVTFVGNRVYIILRLRISDLTHLPASTCLHRYILLEKSRLTALSNAKIQHFD